MNSLWDIISGIFNPRKGKPSGRVARPPTPGKAAHYPKRPAPKAPIVTTPGVAAQHKAGVPGQVKRPAAAGPGQVVRRPPGAAQPPRRQPSAHPGAGAPKPAAVKPPTLVVGQKAIGEWRVTEEERFIPEEGIPVVGGAAPKTVQQAEAEAFPKVVFKGKVITGPGGPIKVAPESRNLCALFEDGTWLVSASHRHSPLVTSVAALAKIQGFQIKDPKYVTPDIIQQAYFYEQRRETAERGIGQYDENVIRRRIVEVIAKAREMDANDIHIEVSGSRTRVEFRVEGLLVPWEVWTQKEGEMFLSALWSHASTQSGVTANWLEPQAAMLAPGVGQDQIALPEGISGLRCQWMPLADGGRYLDIRLHYDSLHILGGGQTETDVDSLGFAPEQMAIIRHLRSIPNGMVVFAAPTNAGKSTSLRVILNRRMVETNMQLNCILIEDPPEGGVVSARQIGISAIHKEEQRERTFIEVMRSALRLDPDIVMLGETRDLTTATFLFRLALTGRQVYTTLHVYAALAIPQRLRDLGIEPYLTYDHNLVRGMLSQRLVRKLCPHCKIPLASVAGKSAVFESLARRVRTALGIWNIEMGKRAKPPVIDGGAIEPDLTEVYVPNYSGCEHCRHGRVGRTVVAEVIETDAKLMRFLSENDFERAREYWLSPEGLAGLPITWHCFGKIQKGLVSPDDAEIELGPLASDREIQDFEKRFGVFKGWQA